MHIMFSEEEQEELRLLLEAQECVPIQCQQELSGVWYHSEFWDSELRILFLMNFRVTVSRVCFLSLIHIFWLRSFTAVHEDVPKCMPETLRVAVVYATGCNSPQIAGSTPALRLENACQLDWYALTGRKSIVLHTRHELLLQLSFPVLKIWNQRMPPDPKR